VKQLTSETIKEFALAHGADVVGVGGIERCEGAPPQMDPRNIFPEARSVIVIARRIPRGVYRGITEGTHWNAYTFYGYNKLNTFIRPLATYETACFIEDHGWEAVPVFPAVSEAQPSKPGPGGDRPLPDVVPNIRIMGVLAGVGEMGYSKVFLTKKFGPRVRLGMILTDAPLAPDPVMHGEICTMCMRCVRDCPGSAIPHKKENKTVEIEVGGKTISWGDVHMGRCTLTHHGLNAKASPFLKKEFPGMKFDVAEQDLSEESAYKIGYKIGEGNWRSTPDCPSEAVVDYYRMILAHTGYFAICGAKGCIRGCMDSLEKAEKIENRFHTPLSPRPAWEI